MDHNRPLVALAIILNTLLFGLILVQCLGCSMQTPRGTPEYSVSDPAVVKMVMTDALGMEGQCTAWKVGTDLVMTAGHCCDDVTVNYRAEGSHAVPGAGFAVVVDDDKHDVCVLAGHIEGAVIELALRDPIIGERVWTEGYPHGILLISEGFWSGRQQVEDGEYGVSSTTVWGGASGSAILNVRGQAVALLVAGFHTFDGMTLTAHIEWMRNALIRAKQLTK